jgi:hypothetical protein
MTFVSHYKGPSLFSIDIYLKNNLSTSMIVTIDFLTNVY